MIHIEEVKLKTDGLDSLELMRQYAKTGFASIEPDHFSLMRWYGAYQQKPNADGYFMLRIKIGGGQLTSAQLAEIARISQEHGKGVGDITTRQNIQFHWLTIESLPEAIDRLSAIGLTTTGACGDITRNVVGCPVAGIDAAETTDATSLLKTVEGRLLGNHRYSNLPRKFKISINGCSLGCSQPQINDIGLTAVRLKSDPSQVRYEMRVGGGLSTAPKFAQPLGVLLGEDEIPEICEIICGIFRDYGNRENRKRARMKFLVEDWGIAKFRGEIESRLGRNLTDWSDDYALPTLCDDDHVGIHPQKEKGLFYVGISSKSGRFYSNQMAAVAAAADQFGRGRIRLTNHQNIILLDIPQDAISPLTDDLAKVGLPVNASRSRRLLVACTGTEFCNLALTDTKNIGARVVDKFEAETPPEEGLRIHISGCPNSCGHYQTGDLGLTGVEVQKKGSDEKIEAYNIFAGGGYGLNPNFGRKLAVRIPTDEVPDLLLRVHQKYLRMRIEGETFHQFCARLNEEEFESLVK